MPPYIGDCGYPGCTTVHNTSRPIAECCPRTKEERRAYNRNHPRVRNTDRDRAAAVERTRRWRARHPERAFASGLWAKYRITPQERLELFEASDGLCALCYEHPATQIDHDHETGRVRGVLCPTCNKGLWFFESRGVDAIVHYLSSDWREPESVNHAQ